MKEFNVYQLQRNRVLNVTENKRVYDLDFCKVATYNITGSDVGSAETIAEIIWDLCNVDCWDADRTDGMPVDKNGIRLEPTDKFIGHVNSDIIVETDDGLYLAEMCGWTKIPTFEYGIYKIIYSGLWAEWDSINNKNELGLTEEKLNSYIKTFSDEE